MTRSSSQLSVWNQLSAQWIFPAVATGCLIHVIYKVLENRDHRVYHQTSSRYHHNSPVLNWRECMLPNSFPLSLPASLIARMWHVPACTHTHKHTHTCTLQPLLTVILARISNLTAKDINCLSSHGHPMKGVLFLGTVKGPRNNCVKWIYGI